MCKFIVVFLLICTFSAFGQYSENEIVEDIREKFKQIHSEKESYFTTLIEKEDNQDTGGVYSATTTSRKHWYKNIHLIASSSHSNLESSLLFFDQNAPILYIDNTEVDGYPPYYKTKIAYFYLDRPFYCELSNSQDIINVNNINTEFKEIINTPNCTEFSFNNFTEYIEPNFNNELPTNTESEINNIQNTCRHILRNKDDYITEITDYYERSLELKTLTKEIYEYEKSFTKNYYSDLKLIEEQNTYETNMEGGYLENKIEQFYFHKGKLFFYYLRNYKISLNTEYSNNPHTGYEKRIYLFNNNPVRILEKYIKIPYNSDYKSVEDIIANKLQQLPNQTIETNMLNAKEVKKYLK